MEYKIYQILGKPDLVSVSTLEVEMTFISNYWTNGSINVTYNGNLFSKGTLCHLDDVP